MAILTALAVLFAACGGDDDSSESVSGRQGAPEQSASEDSAAPGPEETPQAETATGETPEPAASTEAAPAGPEGGGANPSSPPPPSSASAAPKAAAGKASAPAGSAPAKAASPAPGAGQAPAGSGTGGSGAPAPSGPAAPPAKGGGPAPALPVPAAPGGPGGDVPAAKDGVIKIGMVYPLSGPIANIGRSMMEGFRATLQKASDEGAIQGAKFQFIVRDDQFDPALGKRQVRDLLSQGIWAFSGFTPSIWPAAREEFRASGVLGFPFEVGGGGHRSERTSFSGYQMCARTQAGTIPDVIAKGYRKLAFLELDIEGVHHCVGYSVKLAKKLGAEVVYQGSVQAGAPDCAPQIVAARSKNPDILMPFIDVTGTVKCMQARKQQGWDIPVEVGMNVVGDDLFTEALGKDAEGISSVAPFALPGSPEWERSCGDVVTRYFPDHGTNFWYTAAGCAPGIALVKALKALGPQATRDQMIAYLESNTISTDGLTPDLQYKPGDHYPFDAVAPAVVKNGKWVRTGDFFTPPRLTEDTKDGEP